MRLTREIIQRHIYTYPWLSEAETLLFEIEENIEAEPDISVESCKSLLESIAKNILARLDATYSEQEINDLDLSQLLKRAKGSLQEKLDGEFDLIQRFISVAHHIAEIRNIRGEISHGKTFPKIERTSSQTAKTIKSFTDGFASYLLHLFFEIDLSYQEPIKYEDNQDFNDFLDESLVLSGVVYSKALYDQDYVAYQEQLEDYKTQLAPEEEANAPTI